MTYIQTLITQFEEEKYKDTLLDIYVDKEVLAASINEDVIAIVGKTDDGMVQVLSDGYDRITISLDDLSKSENENETTLALTKGVLAGMKRWGYQVGGFQAYITSDVLIGAGLSSSAAYETIVERLYRAYIMICRFHQLKLQGLDSMQKMYILESRVA